MVQWVVAVSNLVLVLHHHLLLVGLTIWIVRINRNVVVWHWIISIDVLQL